MTTPKPTTTTDDIPEFDRKKVALEVPGQAFNSGFALITDISKIINSVIIVSQFILLLVFSFLNDPHFYQAIVVNWPTPLHSSSIHYVSMINPSPHALLLLNVHLNFAWRMPN